jgi:predicted PurR-regulated permease PerM
VNDTVGRFRTAGVLTAVVLTVLLLWMFKLTADVFLLFFIAVLVALYYEAVTQFLVRHTKLPERVAFLVAVLGTVGGFITLMWLLVPPVIAQTQQLFSVLPETLKAWEGRIDQLMLRIPGSKEFWNPDGNRLAEALGGMIESRVRTAPHAVLSAVGMVISVFSVFVMSIYLALQPGIYREWLIALFPPIHRDLVRDVLRDLAVTLRAYITAQLFAMAVVATLSAVGLYFLKVEYWLTFGVFTGLMGVVPFFGSLISTILPALFVLITPDGGTRALFVIIWGIIVHLAEGNLLSPMVMAKQVELPPVLTIMAVLVIGKITGPLGLVVAVPVLATIMVVVRRILISRIYEGQGFRRTTRDRVIKLRVPVPEGGVLLSPEPLIDVIGLEEQRRLKLFDVVRA